MKKILSSFVLLASLSGIVSDSNAEVQQFISSENAEVQQFISSENEESSTGTCAPSDKPSQSPIQRFAGSLAEITKKITDDKPLDETSESELKKLLRDIQEHVSKTDDKTDKHYGVAALVYNRKITIFYATRPDTKNNIITSLQNEIDKRGCEDLTRYNTLPEVLAYLRDINLLAADNSIFQKADARDIHSLQFNTVSHIERQLIGMCLLKISQADSTSYNAKSDIVNIDLDKISCDTNAAIYVYQPYPPCCSDLKDKTGNDGGNITISKTSPCKLEISHVYRLDFYKKLAEKFQNIYFKVYIPKGANFQTLTNQLSNVYFKVSPSNK